SAVETTVVLAVEASPMSGGLRSGNLEPQGQAPGLNGSGSFRSREPRTLVRAMFTHSDRGGVAKWPRRRSAKPLFSGSNPLAASITFQPVSSLRWCSPIGRGNRLKTDSVWVRIPPPAPVSRRRAREPAVPPCYPAKRDELSRRDRVSDRPSRDPLVRDPDGDGDRRRPLARPPSGQARRPAGRRHHQLRPVGDPRGPRGSPALRGRLQLGLLRALPVEDHRGLGGRPRDPRWADPGSPRGRVARVPLEASGPARPRRRSPLHRARTGDRALGELLQRGGLRAADGPALEALHLAPAPPARLRPVRVFPPDLPLRVALGPHGVRAPRRRAPRATRRPPGRALLLLRRPLLGRPLRDRSASARQL